MWDLFDENFFNVIKDPNSWKNFRLTGITCGLETGLLQSDRKEIIGKKLYNRNYDRNEIEDILERYYELKNLIGDENLKKNVCSNIGNPRSYYLNNTLLNFDDLYHVYAFWQINRFFKTSNKNILEIGAGYGNLAQKFIKNSDCKYFIIDIPESLVIQHYYLKINHPECKLQKISSIKDSLDLSNDVFLIPCFFYEIVKELKFDLVINMRSFGEMNSVIIDQYFDLINNVLINDGFFYTVNRYVTYRGKNIIKIKDYPFGSNWTQIISQPQWLQTHLHEFLLQKIEKPNIGFDKILKSFPDRTPPPGPLTKNYSLNTWVKDNKVS